MAVTPQVMQRLVRKIEEVGRRYGLELNKKCVSYVDIRQQAVGKIENPKECTVTLKRLYIFWIHSDNPTKFKIRVYSARRRSTLMYGLEPPNQNRAT